MSTPRIAWVTDSTAFLSPEFRAHRDLYSVPLSIHFGTEEFLDGEGLTTSELYERIRNSKEVPKTSQPPSGKFFELYTRLKEEYDAIFAIHLSDGVSGTYQSSKSGAEMAGVEPYLLDSLTLSGGLTALIRRGMELAESGMEPAAILQELTAMRARQENYILIDKLEQLYKGGRMNGAQFFIGSLLKIKPIIHMSKDGKLEPFDKVRSEKKAEAYVLDKLEQAYGRGVRFFTLVGGNNPDARAKLCTAIQERCPGLEFETGEIGTTLASHAGEGAIGIFWTNPL